MSMSVFVCSQTPPKRLTLMRWNFEGNSPLGADGFRLKKTFEFNQPFAGKQKNAIYTSGSDNPIYHLIVLIFDFPPP